MPTNNAAVVVFGRVLLVLFVLSGRVSFAAGLVGELSVRSRVRSFEFDSGQQRRPKINRSRRGRSECPSSLGASVLDLFRVLEEEEEEAANKKKNQNKIHDNGEQSMSESFRIDGYGDDDDNDDDNDDGITAPRMEEEVEEEIDFDFDDTDSRDDADDGFDDDDDDDEYVVSDAEALLACWSFLKRRKRLGKWTEYEERQAQKALSRNYFLTDDEVGDELLDEILLDDDDDDDDDEDTDAERESRGEIEDGDSDLMYSDNYEDYEVASMTSVKDLLWGVSPLDEDYGADGDIDSSGDVAKDIKIISSLIADHENPIGTDGTEIENDADADTEDIELSYSEFTSFPTEPSDTRLRRVNAMKRRWEDLNYRERWYQKRWGNRKRKTDTQTELERKAIQRARTLPQGFLGSEELASMTEEEIADAIRARIESTRKRVTRRKQTLRGRKEFLAAQMNALEEVGSEGDDDNNSPDGDIELQNLSRDSLFAPDAKKLEEAKRERSERAKRLYATRLKNQEVQKKESETNVELSSSKSPSSSSSSSKSNSSPRKKGPYYPPKQLTPQDAFLRIENDLDRGLTPSVDDIRLILVPGKMKNRKPLLRRILLDKFNLRGKCVPPVRNADGDSVSDSDSNDNTDDSDGYDDSELEFVHRCTIQRLGVFIIHLLERDDTGSS